jgi:hypothetical protein
MQISVNIEKTPLTFYYFLVEYLTMKNKYQKLILFTILCAGIAFIITGCADPVDLKAFFEDDIVSEIITEGDSGSKPPVFNKTISNTLELQAELAAYHAASGRNNETWRLRNNTYELQVIIEKNLTLIGDSQGGVIITGPQDYSTLKGFQSGDIINKAYYISYNLTYNNGNTHANTSIKSYVISLVTITNGINATLKDLTVKGIPARYASAVKTLNTKATETSGFALMYSGIGVIGAQAVIENVNITDIINNPVGGDQHGYGIVAAGKTGTSLKDITIKDCTITNFQKNAVHIQSGVRKITFTGNTVIGSNEVYPAAQNGIVIECLQAEITRNNFLYFKWQKNNRAITLGVYFLLTPANGKIAFTTDFRDEAINRNIFDITNHSDFGENDSDWLENDNVSQKVFYMWDDEEWEWPAEHQKP